jgi:hypothetical protein
LDPIIRYRKANWVIVDMKHLEGAPEATGEGKGERDALCEKAMSIGGLG